MIKRISQTFLLAILIAFCSNSAKAIAQSPTCGPDDPGQCIVSGGDPQPIQHAIGNGVDTPSDTIVSGGDPQPIQHIVGIDQIDSTDDMFAVDNAYSYDDFIFDIFMLFGIA